MMNWQIWKNIESIKVTKKYVRQFLIQTVKKLLCHYKWKGLILFTSEKVSRNCSKNFKMLNISSEAHARQSVNFIGGKSSQISWEIFIGYRLRFWWAHKAHKILGDWFEIGHVYYLSKVLNCFITLVWEKHLN